jgi:hypothetical protein
MVISMKGKDDGMTNIVVTTPQTHRKRAAQEALDCIGAGGGFYFRRFGGRCFPKRLETGDRVYFVQENYLRGFALVSHFEVSTGVRCDTSEERYGSGHYVFMDASTWKWVMPTLFKGFQGYRYAETRFDLLPILGGWLDPMPSVQGAVLSQG